MVFPESVEQLSRFAEKHAITVPLLADPDSEIITEIGILNTTIDESEEFFIGIPYPGAYVIGADGRVSAKFFEQNSLVRADPEVLLRAALGEEIAPPPADPVVRPSGNVEFSVALDGDRLAAFLVRDLVVSLRVPQGQHLYGPPVSEGLVVTSVDIDSNKWLGVMQAAMPTTRPLVLEGTGETLHVYEGDVTVRVPVVYNGAPVGDLDADGNATIEIAGTLRWQSCDDVACQIPRTERFSITVPVGEPNVPTMLKAVMPDQSGD